MLASLGSRDRRKFNSVLALPQEQILQKLGPVPVFTITDSKGAPLVASVPNAKNKAAVAGVFINQEELRHLSSS